MFLTTRKNNDFLNRIRCITYRGIRNEMIARTEDLFITLQWTFEKLHRGESGVRRTWNKATE